VLQFDSVVYSSQEKDGASILYNEERQVFMEGKMPATYSYANILHAIGQVLDQIGVKSIAIHEEEDGLFIEGYSSEDEVQVQLRCDIASLYELVNSSEASTSAPEPIEQETDASVLRRFLAEHSRTLVGTAL
jgi:hypothetical protein